MSDHGPPHSLEAEESVLGAMMLSPAEIDVVAEKVRPPDFYRSANGRIYAAILAIHARREPVDAITAVEELHRCGALEDVGGALYVANLVESVPTPASARYYAKIVADHALVRRTLDVAHAVVRDRLTRNLRRRRMGGSLGCRHVAIVGTRRRCAVVSWRAAGRYGA